MRRLSSKRNLRKQGRKSILDEHRLRRFHRCVRKQCFASLYVIVAYCNQQSGFKLSKRTASCCMRQIKVYSIVSIQKPFISYRNIRRRVMWVRKHRYWTEEQWARVVFTDESCFLVKPAKNYIRVWHMRGEHLHPDHIIPTFKSGYQCVSVWACFSKYGRTPLVGYCGTFTQTTYRSVIDQHLLPFI